MPLRIANAAGFLGDSLAAPRRLVESAAVDYLTLEYLAELTLSILARTREKDAQRGYADDFLLVLKSLTPALLKQPRLKIVTNAGGMNPLACAAAAAAILREAGLANDKIAVVTGDDLLQQLASLTVQGEQFAHFESGEAWPHRNSTVSANAYLGAPGIAKALQKGARIVITGRVADASLTVGPAMHEFGTAWNDWNRLAGYSVAGHLIECGAQVTGGYSVDWSQYNLAEVGYPIAEVEADGSCVITKPLDSGGAVNRRTVVEQLVYEIGDPRHYLTPDVDCDFTTVQVDDLGHDRVQVSGAAGNPAPTQYKVSMAYRDGFFASGELLAYGPQCHAIATAAAEMLFARLAAVDCIPVRKLVELLGRGDAVPGRSSINSPTPAASEIMLRIAVHDSCREVVDRFTREFAPLITSGPAGLAGYAAGRPSVRPVYAYWPSLIEKSHVAEQVEVRTAREWLS